MSEGKKHIRLKQAATEFNVATNTIVEFLAKKGIEIENKPTSKIEEDAYAMLEDAFLSENKRKTKLTAYR